MDFIRRPLSQIPDLSQLSRISIVVDRHDLAKRRWRGVAGDGREFGFDLEEPMHHEAVFFLTDTAYYIIVQQAERVIEVSLGDATTAARLGWTIGNLHFPIQIEHEMVRVTDDPAVRQLLLREHLAFHETKAVFQPLKGVAHAH